jgi:lysozyme
MKTNQKGVALIIEFEGFRSEAYIPVPGDVPTIGFGFTRGVQMGDKMTRSEAAARLKEELGEYEAGVLSACTVEPNENEFAALVSFAFNVGVGALRKSSVIKAHNRGDKQAAARAFSLWNRSGGKVYAGLTRRRAAEAALYLTPAVIDEVQMPQSIDHETPMTASTINRASVVAGGTATLAAVSETFHAVNQVKSEVGALGDWLLPVLLVAVVGLCGYVVWQRIQQRKGGWA